MVVDDFDALSVAVVAIEIAVVGGGGRKLNGDRWRRHWVEGCEGE